MENKNYYKLNEGEKILGGSDNQSFVFDKGGFLLTNQRVIKVDVSKMGGEVSVHSFNLESLDTVQNLTRKPLAFLVLGWMLGVFGIITLAIVAPEGDELTFPIIMIVVSGISFLLYFLLRSRIILLASGRSNMILNVTPMAFESIQELMFSIEEAKQKRLEQLRPVNVSSKQSVSLKEKLLELEELYKENLISQDEYLDKRKKLVENY